MKRQLSWFTFLLSLLGFIIFWLTYNAGEPDWAFGLGSLVLLILSTLLFIGSRPTASKERFRMVNSIRNRRKKGDR